MHYRRVNTKSILSHKLKFAQKKSFMRKKTHSQINFNLLVNLATFEKKNRSRMGSSLAANNSKTENQKNLKYDLSVDSAHFPFFM